MFRLAAVVALALPATGFADMLNDLVNPSVQVRVDKDQVCGSGTCIKIKGRLHVLTAGHVVADARKDRFEVHFDSDGKEHKKKVSAFDPVFLYRETSGVVDIRPADVVWYSPIEPQGGHDLALLVPRDPTGLVPARLASGEPDRGDDAWYIGTPGGLHHSLEKSIFNRIDFPLFDKTFYLVNGNGWFGNSGGGVFQKREGRYYLTGVVTMKYSLNPSPLIAQTLPIIKGVIKQYQSKDCDCDDCSCEDCQCGKSCGGGCCE